jgi:hypothetical protein
MLPDFCMNTVLIFLSKYARNACQILLRSVAGFKFPSEAFVKIASIAKIAKIMKSHVAHVHQKLLNAWCKGHVHNWFLFSKTSDQPESFCY